MTQSKPGEQSKPKLILSILLLMAFISVVTAWTLLTPEGLIGKLGAISYSVCHQNPDHTLNIGGKLLPLCARCTGMFLGCLVALIYLKNTTSGTSYPASKIRWVLGALLLFFCVDGVNSALAAFDSSWALYAPTNPLRLVSGLGMGIVLAAVLLPMWRQTMQFAPQSDPGLDRWAQLILLLVIDGALAALVLFGNPWLFWPVAVLSVLAIPILVAMVYTLLWILFLKKENTIRNRTQEFTYILLGCLTAFVQIGLIDLLRFTLTGTWTGISF